MTKVSWPADLYAKVKHLYESGFGTAQQMSDEIAGAKSRNAILGMANRDHWAKPERKPQAARTRTTPFRRPEAPKLRKLLQIAQAAIPGPVGGKPLLDLEPHECRYPITENSPYFFCAAGKTEDSSYCAEHRQICERPALWHPR